MRTPAKILSIIQNTVQRFIADDCFAMAGAIAYFTLFSLPGLLVIVIAVAGFIFGEEAARGEIERQVRVLMSEGGAKYVQEMVAHAAAREESSSLASILGLVGLLFGATGAFVQLQSALNLAWHVEPDPNQGGVMNFVQKRLLSFGMVLGIGFLLLVSLVVSALISAFGNYIGAFLTSDAQSTVIQTLNLMISFTVITVLFAAMFKILPDAEIAWRDVWGGAIFTSIMFGLGKFAIGFYLGQSNMGDAYGAAGSLAIVLVWIYYSAAIFLLGAEFTQVWTRHEGKHVVPEEGAAKVKIIKQTLTPQ